MKTVILKVLVSLVSKLIGAHFFEYLRDLVIAQLSTTSNGDEKRAAVKAEVDLIKGVAIDSVKGTAKEALVTQAQKSSNRFVNLAIEIIVATL
jgi:hypothetical protein